MELAFSIKSNYCDMTLSDITVKNDGRQHRHLKELCKEKNISLIQNDKTITARHLHGSRLHLNKRGTKIISKHI